MSNKRFSMSALVEHLRERAQRLATEGGFEPGNGSAQLRTGNIERDCEHGGYRALPFLSFMVLSVFLMVLLAGCGGSGGSDPGPTPAPAATRTFFIAAEDVNWDYANGTVINQTAGIPFADDPDAPVFTENVTFANAPNAAGVRIGSTYRKTLYFEYTDATFTTRKPVPAEWQHLGSMGPILRAEVGDTIKITFRNRTTLTNSFTMHPHGVFYDKSSEGAAYVGGDPSDFTAGNSVAPGTTFTYTWEVPERAGPGPNDGASTMWAYHSHVLEPQEENTGLIGPMIIYKKGAMKPVGATGIDREFVVLFKVFDENDSLHLQSNITTFTGAPDPADPAISDDGDFQESNLMHAMNGYIYGNLPLENMTMKKGENVRWYVMAAGTEVDLHTPHWHGNTGLTMGGTRADVVGLLPMEMMMVDMTPDNPGTWLFHCHVNDHIKAGMIARYKVEP